MGKYIKIESKNGKTPEQQFNEYEAKMASQLGLPSNSHRANGTIDKTAACTERYCEKIVGENGNILISIDERADTSGEIVLDDSKQEDKETLKNEKWFPESDDGQEWKDHESVNTMKNEQA